MSLAFADLPSNSAERAPPSGVRQGTVFNGRQGECGAAAYETATSTANRHISRAASLPHVGPLTFSS
jgi:hypothetical protein